MMGAVRKGGGGGGLGAYSNGNGNGGNGGNGNGGGLSGLLAGVVSSPRRRVQGMVLAAAVLILLLMFSSSGSSGSSSSSSSSAAATPSLAGSSSKSSSSSSGKRTYSVVIDAGSTGSRVHVFEFEGEGASLSLVSDTFEQLKPGLSAYGDDPAAAAASLKPLLDKALATVPELDRARTGVTLKATAGLRLLPGGKADAILAAVRELLGPAGGYPFLLGGNGGGDEAAATDAAADAPDPAEAAVSIMDGAHEGAYAWLTLNYLLGRVGKQAGAVGTSQGPVAAIDLGGGSVQEAFALGAEEAAAAPDGYVTRLRAGGVDYDVYVHSYLGYGLMAARAKVIEAHGSGGGAGGGGGDGADSDGGADGDESSSSSSSHPCFARGTQLTYSYAGKDYPVREVEEHGDFKRCAQTALKALEHEKACGADDGGCSFAGAWRGKPGGGGKGGPPHLPSSAPRAYYVSSYFWDRAVDAGIVEDAQAIEWATSPADFARRAAAACGKPEDAKWHKTFGGRVHKEAAPYFCLDLSFCHTVLTQGFDLPESAPIKLVKQVMYKGSPVEAAWPLGAASAALA